MPWPYKTGLPDWKEQKKLFYIEVHRVTRKEIWKGWEVSRLLGWRGPQPERKNEEGGGGKKGGKADGGDGG